MADTAIGVPLFYLLPCQAWINFIFSTGVILQHSTVWASWFLELHHYRLNAILLDLSGSLYFWAGVCLGGIFVSSYSFAAVYCLQTCQSSKTQSCSRHRCFFVFFNLHLFDQRINDFSRPDHGYPQGDNSRKSEHLWHFSKHFMDGCWVMRSAKTRVGGTIEF